MNHNKEVEIDRLVRYGVLVILIAIVINTTIYFIANSFDIFSEEVINPNTDSPIPMSEIIIVSIFQMVIGLFGLALATEITKQPLRLFRIMATIFLLISFTFPFTIENATISVIVSLVLMHVVSGLLMIVVLPRLIIGKQQVEPYSK